MTNKPLVKTAALTAAFLITTGAYAGGGMGAGMSGGQSMMGSQGNEMMGSGPNSMMDSGPNYSNPWTSPQPGKTLKDPDKQRERDQLREEIREKRQELSKLHRSDKTNRELIDRKIAELNELEKAFDRSFSGAN